MSLFRNQALEHAQQKSYGAVLLISPPSYYVVTGVCTVLVALIVVFLFTVEVSRKETVSGTVMPDLGLINAAAPFNGVVREIRVSEGQRVEAGDPLMVLSGELTNADGAASAAQVSRAYDQQKTRFKTELAETGRGTATRIKSLEERISNLAGQIKTLDEELALQRGRVEIAKANQDRFANLQKQGFVSEARREESAAGYLDQQTRERQLHRELSQKRAEKLTLENDIADARVSLIRQTAQLERGMADAERGKVENESRRETIVVAPAAGTVSALAVSLGQPTQAGQSLLTLVPKGGVLIAELAAPSRAVGFLKVGMPVLIRYEAYPYAKFGQGRGEVREISVSPLPGTKDGEAVYRVRVMLADTAVTAFGKREPLRPGMRLEASLVLENRKLAEWVIEPLLGLTGKL